ncbi:MAG: beta-lactamase family protein [Planctomycetaceae bacterium]|nr:beta-lactamase family protein [Planctomycetaceae bacterium]
MPKRPIPEHSQLPVTRRAFTLIGAASLAGSFLHRVVADVNEERFDQAANVLRQACESGSVTAAAIHVRSGNAVFDRGFGKASVPEASFLLGSISKPVTIAALMTLFDQNRFQLDDAVHRYLPEFNGGGRSAVTIRHLLTHISGLPDQLADNADLRARHAGLSDFIAGALKAPLSFPPGTKYQYSSMGILLAAEIAQRLSGMDIRRYVHEQVLRPLKMTNSALGMGGLTEQQVMPCQVEFGAVESGGGSEESKNWDWNSPFWRNLGAPWGGLHASAADVGRFLAEMLHPEGKVVRPATAALMTRNHNPEGFHPRGLGFDVGMAGNCRGCSGRTFGHTGSTGTIAWADPDRDLMAVVLTTLPGRATASDKHPRQQASEFVAGSA